MKILFSEARPDYSHYVFPYVIWAVPDPGEPLSQIFQAGFLPASPHLDRFYMARHLRVCLRDFELSSENRRVLRKGSGVSHELVPREKFDYNEARRHFFKSYADLKWGKDVMSLERLDTLFASPVISHLLVFREAETGAELGVVALLLLEEQIAFYYYSFYDLNRMDQNLGMHMMTSAVKAFQQLNYSFLYLGTCYSERALYKTQFEGVEFFNGFSWSRRLDELKYLIRRQDRPGHLLSEPEYYGEFYPAGLPEPRGFKGT